MGDELHVEVTGRHTQRADHRVHVQSGHVRVDRQAGDARLLGGLAQGGGDDVGVAVLAVPAELQPAAEPRMQRQQGLRSGVVEHQRGGGDVAWHASSSARIFVSEHERQHRVPQRVLSGVGRLPGGQRLERGFAEHRHLRTREPVGRRRIAGSGRLGRIADGDRAQRFPVGGQVQFRPDQVGGEDRRADPAAADTAHGQRDKERLNGRPDRDGEHGVLGRGSDGVRVAVRTVGNQERDHQFGRVVEDLAAADPALDGRPASCRRRRGRIATCLSCGPAAGAWQRCRPSTRTAPAGCGAARAR